MTVIFLFLVIMVVQLKVIVKIIHKGYHIQTYLASMLPFDYLHTENDICELLFKYLTSLFIIYLLSTLTNIL